MLSQMAGIRGKSGPPANQNAFKHGLAGVSQRRANGGLAPDEQTIREDILAGLIADKGGEEQLGTAERILAGSAAMWRCWSRSIKPSRASSRTIRKPGKNPKALAQLDGYKRPLVGSLSANLQRFGMEKVAKMESLQKIIEEMTEDPGGPARIPAQTVQI
jgi:hypothetical protein